jgi:hypothetical protein
MLRVAVAKTRPRVLPLGAYIPALPSFHTTSTQATKMRPAAIRAVPFPSESRLRSLYKTAYFIDAFAVSLPERKSGQYNPDTLARAFFCEQPAWFSVLMWIRDRVMSIFGVKSSTELQAAAETKGIDTIAIFPVISRTDNEIILGATDSHLDFQTSILIREDQHITEGYKDNNVNGKEMVAMTVVHCHGFFGKAYITIIKAFHVMIIKYNLARVPSRIIRDKLFEQ